MLGLDHARVGVEFDALVVVVLAVEAAEELGRLGHVHAVVVIVLHEFAEAHAQASTVRTVIGLVDGDQFVPLIAHIATSLVYALDDAELDEQADEDQNDVPAEAHRDDHHLIVVVVVPLKGRRGPRRIEYEADLIEPGSLQNCAQNATVRVQNLRLIVELERGEDGAAHDGVDEQRVHVYVERVSTVQVKGEEEAFDAEGHDAAHDVESPGQIPLVVH